MDAGEDIQLIDVRQPDEYAFAKIEGAKLIPLGEIVKRMDELDDRNNYFNANPADAARMRSRFSDARRLSREMANLKGGITAWSNEVDPNIPKY